jgi:hypothetical protein
MKRLQITNPNPHTLARLNDVMQQAGQAANASAARHIFTDHIENKSNNTERRKRADLALFETFLQSAGVPASDLFSNPHAWRGVTWGIVEAFRNWMLQQGYAIGSINGRLSTVRTYAKIAARVEAITPQESILIASVQYAPADGIIWRKSSKGTGKLGGQISETSTTRAINKRVELLGRHTGIEGLSAHDCRHYDATFKPRNGTPINRIMDKFGWNSPAMALRYIEAAHIANEGTARVKQT